MPNSTEIAPAVESILGAARRREPPDRTVSVDPRSFDAAVQRAAADSRVPVVAEVKPTSPTTEGVREDDPVALAERMVAGGATALSVLTEPEHFGGSPETLRAVRGAVDVPVLRKDFILQEPQLDTVTADVVLLIARFVDDLDGLVAAAQERGFQVLVEAHNRDEVAAAESAGADIVGINNRDLAELTVDLGTFESVAPTVSEGTTLLAESGIETQADVQQMCGAGADALLVGSAIMDGDVEANTRRLVNA
jgi:indole-3-glycerol phosphate synthase